MPLKILILVVGAFPVSLAATTCRGLTLKNYFWYALSQVFATAFFLYANKDMPPLTYALSIGGIVSLLCVVVVWFKGVTPSPLSILGALLILLGTYLTFK